MAYIIGLLSDQEEAELKRRGWTVEQAPKVDFDTGMTSNFPGSMRMVWVDQDMFKIMDGPDWDRGNTGDPGQKGEVKTGDTLYERWWNSLTRDQRALMFAKGRLQTPEQVELRLLCQVSTE
jgi:hypothetical protein